MRKQLRRWSHGFVQNVRLHARGLLGVRYLRSLVGVAMWDATIASIAYVAVVPLLALLVSPWFLLGYVIDAPAVLMPVLITARRRRVFGRAVASVPGFLILRFVNAIFFLEAVWSELVLRRRLTQYEKGH
jgi:biofilm PGA synthesis N-glycosyltransferase PgaC